MGFDMDALTRIHGEASARTRRVRGTTMVEMIFVLPVLLLLLFGLADFSLVFHDYLASMNAARAGVRAATLAQVPCTHAAKADRGRKVAEGILNNNAVKAFDPPKFFHSEPGPVDLCKPGHVEIQIHVKSQHKLLSGFLGVVAFPPIEFTAAATAMNENGF
jgi:hypothetical protein